MTCVRDATPLVASLSVSPRGRASTDMRVKQRLEATRAQLAESAVLLAAVAWSTWLASALLCVDEYSSSPVGPRGALLRLLLPRVLQVLNALAVAAIGRALLATQVVPKPMDELSRQERDSGLPVGCILPPLVLLSHVLVVAYSDNADASGRPVPSLLYAWIALSASASLLIKTVCFGSASLFSIAIVDVVLLPLIFSYLGVESDVRFVIPVIGRVVVSLVFRYGRLALRRSFTVGEAHIVAQCIGLGVVDLALVTIHKLRNASNWRLPDRFVNAWHLHGSSLVDREPHQLALQVGVAGALLICVALTPVLSRYGSSSPHVVSPPLPLGATLQFLVTVVVVLGGVVYPWSAALLDTWNPIAWLLNFLLVKPTRRYLVLYWVVCLAVCVPAFAVISRVFDLRQIIARKLFHALVVAMFVPAFFYAPDMLSLSYGVAFAVFCLAECVRAVSLPPLGQQIAEFVKPFIDHREGGRVILTHTYLLLGCALPLWLAHSTAPSNALAANAGVLALGVGDAMGAAIGSTYGRRTLFGRKTLEGTAAVLISMTTASLALHDYHWRALTDGSLAQFTLLIFGAALTSLLEASTSQIDNLVLSLFLFAIANLVTCHA